MDDFSLQCYITLCSQLNFTTAAQTMYVSQPTMTRLIAGLETEMGCKLINRGNNGLTLTLAGQEFLKGAKNIIKTKQNVISHVQAIANNSVEEIHVGYMAQVSYAMMPIALKEAKNKLPEIKLSLEPNQHYALVQDLADEKIDIAILSTFESVPLDFKGNILNKDWNTDVLFHTPIIATFHENHPFEGKEYLTKEDMQKERLLFYEPYDSVFNRNEKSISPIMLYFSQYHDFVPENYRTVGDLFGLLSIVECDAGIGIMPSDMIRFSSPHMKFLPIEFHDEKACSLQCVICYKKSNTKPAVKAVAELFLGLDMTRMLPRKSLDFEWYF